jgi:DNA-binding LacI/PurR family transcriptional regulator
MSIKKAPKYATLASQIRGQIREDILKPGDRLPSIAEMCSEHGVTPTTISKVYSVLQQEGLIECGRGRGTFVATPPEKILTGIIGISGITSLHAQNPYSHPHSAATMRGFIETASKAGFELLLLNENSTREWDRLDGVITYGSEAEEVLSQLPTDMPAVTTLFTVPNVPGVVADDHAGINLLVDHLVSLGHRRIATLLDPLSPRRLSAYTEALYRAEIEPKSKWIRRISLDVEHERYYPEVGYDAMKQWLREDWRDLDCTAIVTQNDDTANGVIEALREAGRFVPEEVSVTGFDGTEVGSYLKPQLTTVEVPLQQVGAAAMELLLQQIQGTKVRPITMTLPVSLKIGESTGPRHRGAA